MRLRERLIVIFFVTELQGVQDKVILRLLVEFAAQNFLVTLKHLLGDHLGDLASVLFQKSQAQEFLQLDARLGVCWKISPG